MNILTMIISLLKRSIKNKITFAILLITPAIGVLLSIVIYSNHGEAIKKVAIVNYDNSETSHEFIDYLSNNIEETIVNLEDNNLMEELVSKEIDYGIVVEKVDNTGEAKVEVVFMKEEGNLYILQHNLENIVNNFKNIYKIKAVDSLQYKNIIKNSEALENSITIRSEEPQNNSTFIGFIILFMMIIINNSLTNIIKDKDNNILNRVISSNTTLSQYIIAEIIWALIMAVGQCIVILFVIEAFNINIAISAMDFLIVLLLISLLSISFGIFVVSLCKSEEQMSIMNTVVIFPMCMLSGCLWPLDIMGESFKKLSYIFPQRRIIDLFMQMTNKVDNTTIIFSIITIILISLLIMVIGIFNINNRFIKENS